MARKPNNQPATAYDYRRAIALVQVLALNDLKALRELAHAWGVPEPTLKELQHSRSWMQTMAVRLAQHALEGPPDAHLPG